MNTQNSSPSSTDILVIGGGLAGLSAATYLARAGVNVTLFEKASNLGGRAATQHHGEYLFNRGIHAIYSGGAATEVLQELGIQYSGHPAKHISVLHQNKLYIAPLDAISVMRTTLLSPGDKLELVRVLAALPQVKAEEVRHISVQEWIEHATTHPQIRQFLLANAWTFCYSSALDLVSADVFIVKMQLALKHPVLYIDGGWEVLVNGLRSAAEQAGVRIRSGVHVETVEHENGQVTGVRLRDGSVISTSAAVIATSPKEALKLVDDGSYQPLHQIVDSLIPARVACLDVALSHLPDPKHAIVQDMDHSRFMSTQSLYSQVTPQGGALIYSFKQLDATHPSDPREDERDLENLLDTVQPGWRELVVKRVYLPHIEAIGMLPTKDVGGYTGRPGPHVPGITNLYLAGDWIGEGFLSDASFGSARQVARLLLQSGVLNTARDQR